MNIIVLKMFECDEKYLIKLIIQIAKEEVKFYFIRTS